MVDQPRKFHLPFPYPDENCYSILCRFAVRRGWQSTHQVCQEVFGHDIPLSGYMVKPFKVTDIRKWHGAGDVLYGSDHSCYQYLSVFLEKHDREQLKKCAEGSILRSGEEKKLGRKISLRSIRKRRLWYCPLCVRDDFRSYGETCWRRLPQMPGVSYCPIHGVRLVESGVSTSDLDCRLIPASYAVSYVPEPDTDVTGNVFQKEFMSVAKDTEWLLWHGFEYPSYDETLRIINEATNGRGIMRLHAENGNQKRVSCFENYLISRVLKDMGSCDLNDSLRSILGLILTIEGLSGGTDRFW